MTHWEYLTLCENLAAKQGVKVFVKCGTRSLWGKVIGGDRIGDVSHFRVDLDENRIIYITHMDVIKISKDGEEDSWPRYKNEGQTKLF